MSEPETQRAAGETPDDGPLLEELRELIGEKGQLRVAELIEVSERTLQRTLASGRLTVRMRDIHELRRRKQALGDVRADLRRARALRFLGRVLTLGLPRRYGPGQAALDRKTVVLRHSITVSGFARFMPQNLEGPSRTRQT